MLSVASSLAEFSPAPHDRVVCRQSKCTTEANAERSNETPSLMLPHGH
jgi:hypothetical protein